MPELTPIFLLSHMRACTSLAGHVLGSHPQINGYFEMHISYDDAAALRKQLEVFQRYETVKQNSRYIFDKLLHNDYRLNPGRLGVPGTKVLLSLLEPERTIKSIVDLFSKKAVDDLYASPEGASSYYVERVRALADFSRSADWPCYYYDAQLFQTAPGDLLARLADWLGLDSPLSERYQLFSQTGKAGKGDSSDLILSGKIEKARANYSHVRLPEDELARAVEAYRDCRSQIVANAADSLLSQAEQGTH